MPRWQDDHGKAVALMDEAKEIAAAGFPEGMESQNKFKAKMKEADDFIARAKLAKEGEEKRAELLKMHDAGAGIDPQTGQPTGEPAPTGQPDPATAGNGGVQIATAPPRGEQVNELSDRRIASRKTAGRLLVSRRLAEVWGKKVLGAEIDKLQTAALAEGAGTTGGYLVVPQYMQDLFAQVRRQGNTLMRLGWLNIHQTDQTNQVLLPKAAGSGAVGIVSELQSLPTADNNYNQVSVPIYNMGGIYNVSKQIADDADPAVMEIVAEDLGSLLGNLEEQNILNGSGSNAPLGILNTSGTAALPGSTQTALNGAITGQILINAIIDAFAAVKATYFAPCTGVIMRPLRMAFLQKTQDSAGNYLFNSPGTFRAPGVMSEGVTSVSLDTDETPWQFLGIPVASSQNIPNTLGGSNNADAIIAASWREAHFFMRQEPTVDSSDIAGDAYETNKVKYRLQERAGFTANRYPGAFCIVTGTGMTGA